MNQVILPASKVSISQAIFGTSRLGGTVEQYDKKKSCEILERAFDSGISTFDTANIYAQGNSEKLLGAVMKRHREKVVLATKGGYAFSSKGRLLSLVKPMIRKVIGSRPGLVRAAGKMRGGQMKQDFSRAGLTKSLDDSLKRLKSDYVDIYQLHSPDQETLEKGEVFEILEDFKQAGKIRAAGVSLLSWAQLAHCYGKGVDFAQLEADFLSGIDRSRELTAAAKDGIVVAARQPFGSGLVAKDPKDWAEEQFGGDSKRLERARQRMTQIKEIGDPFKVILRHVLHSSQYPTFLFATTNLRHLESNFEIMGEARPDSEEVNALAKLFVETSQ
jgi:aryl-alcohol dehydrogenase-like predicted oxidoreductase